MEGSFPLRKLSPRSTLLNVIYNLTVKQYLMIMKIYVPTTRTNVENKLSMRIKKSNICDKDIKQLITILKRISIQNNISCITFHYTNPTFGYLFKVYTISIRNNIEFFLIILNKIIIICNRRFFFLTHIDFTSCSLSFHRSRKVV